MVQKHKDEYLYSNFYFYIITNNHTKFAVCLGSLEPIVSEVLVSCSFLAEHYLYSIIKRPLQVSLDEEHLLTAQAYPTDHRALSD